MNSNPTLLLSLAFAVSTHAALITAVPGPDDQGGMIMPMVTIAASAGMASNPTAGAVNISFSPPASVVLKATQEWSPGNWYAETAAWRSDLSSTLGIGGTPAANAGNGDLFSNRYGFTFMTMGSMMMANVPTGNALAIRLDSVSSTSLKSFNYGNSANLWDPVFDGAGSQVLWNGSMWHNYFTLPNSAPAGDYSATFEVFVASTAFTGSTGFAQYDAAALSAAKNPNFSSALVTYNFSVIPEPTSAILLGIGSATLLIRRRR